MRILRVLALSLSLFASNAFAAITYVGSGTAAGAPNANAIAPSIHASTTTGDAIIMVWARTHDDADGGQLTTGTAVSGYTQIAFSENIGTEPQELAIYCRIATGTDTISAAPPSGTDGTGDAHMARAHTFRGTATSCASIVAHVSTGGTDADAGCAHPALTVTTANTVVISACTERTAWTSVAVLTTSSLGWAEISDDFDTSGEDTNIATDYVIETTATSIAAGSFTRTGGTNENSASISVSLAAAASCSGSPTITDVDTDESVTATQTNIVITGTNFCSSGTVTLRQNGNSKTLSQDSYADTSIQVDMSGVGMGVADGLLYGSADVRVENAVTNTDDQTITVTAPSGTIYATLSGGLVTLAFDGDGNPNRLFGDPIDLLPASQVALRNASGCTLSTDVAINADGSLTVDDTCTAFDYDYTDDDGVSSSHRYIGSVASITWAGNPPHFGVTDIPNLVFQVNKAIATFDLSAFFVPGDEAITSYTMKALSSTSDSTTDCNGTQTNVMQVTVYDSSVLLASVGNYVQLGSGGSPVRLKWVNPLTNKIGLYDPRSCNNNDSVYTRTVSGTSVTGLTLNSGSGVLSGTPTSSAVTGPIVFRAQTAAGTNVDSP